MTRQIIKGTELTKACKFSNFFTDSACLGREVNGQADTIRASFLLGNDCMDNTNVKRGHYIKQQSYNSIDEKQKKIRNP